MGAAELIRTGFGFLVKWMEHAVYRVVLAVWLPREWWRSLCGDGCQGSVVNAELAWGWRGLTA